MSNENKPAKKNNYPALADLTSDVEQAFKNDQFNWMLNQAPKQNWVREHPHISGHFYIPIGILEILLKQLVKEYQIEVLETKQLMNAIQTTVRLHYIHPASNNWVYHDGVGAWELQTQKGTGTLSPDMSNIQRGAVPMATGASKSVAIKNAAAHIGKLFGADLNRGEDVLSYQPDKNLQNRMNEKAVLTDSAKEMAKESLKAGDITLDYLESMYNLSDEQKEELEGELAKDKQ